MSGVSPAGLLDPATFSALYCARSRASVGAAAQIRQDEKNGAADIAIIQLFFRFRDKLSMVMIVFIHNVAFLY